MSQSEALLQALSDGKPHRSDDLVREVYGLSDGVWLARLAARVWDLKKKYGLEIESWRDPSNKKLWFYQVKAGGNCVPKPPVAQALPLRTAPASSFTKQPEMFIEIHDNYFAVTKVN